MENNNRNLFSLQAEFRDKGKALRGYNTIMELIESKQTEVISHLLRFHIPIGVYGEELIKRFDIDALIEYYNLLLVAGFSGYVTGSLDEKLRKEIITVLSNPSVIPYYTVHYPYKMVSYTLQFANENRVFEQEGNKITLSAFNEFISLNRLLKRDKDIERFLGMLDYVRYDDDTINEVNDILSSYSKLNETFTTSVKSEAQSGVWGFIKYTVFLSQFRKILESTKNYPLFQSSMWMFHGYYFDRINDKMKYIFYSAFENLEGALSNPEIFKNIVEELYNSELPDDFNESQLKSFVKKAINQSRKDVNYVLNTKWSIPLKEYFNINVNTQAVTSSTSWQNNLNNNDLTPPPLYMEG